MPYLSNERTTTDASLEGPARRDTGIRYGYKYKVHALSPYRVRSSRALVGPNTDEEDTIGLDKKPRKRRRLKHSRISTPDCHCSRAWSIMLRTDISTTLTGPVSFQRRLRSIGGVSVSANNQPISWPLSDSRYYPICRTFKSVAGGIHSLKILVQLVQKPESEHKQSRCRRRPPYKTLY